MRQKTAEQVSIPDPDYFVEVEYNDISEEAFQQRRQGKELILAYHGSRAENFHSIVNHGLHSHLNKVQAAILIGLLHRIPSRLSRAS